MDDEENFYNEGPNKARVCGFFLVYHQGCLSLVALVLSDELGALLQVRGEFGAGNVYCLLVDIFQSHGQKFCSGTRIRQA
jgi:hypothetical protein